MKKHSSLIILSISILMVIGGYFIYKKFIYPSYLNNSSQEVKTLLKKENHLVLIKRPDQSKIYGIELEISPSKTANYTVIIPQFEDVPHEARVKRGKEFVYKTNWHEDTCILTFLSDESATDSITVSYRFLGLNR